MPAERVEMRRVREILRYQFEQGLGHKSIAVRVGTAPSTVGETLRRAAVAGLRGPLVTTSATQSWRPHSTGGRDEDRTSPRAGTRLGAGPPRAEAASM